MEHPEGWENPRIYKAHGGQVHLEQIKVDLVGVTQEAQGHRERGMIAGSPQKLVLQPRPLSPPLLPALTEPLTGGRTRAKGP